MGVLLLVVVLLSVLRPQPAPVSEYMNYNLGLLSSSNCVGEVRLFCGSFLWMSWGTLRVQSQQHTLI